MVSRTTLIRLSVSRTIPAALSRHMSPALSAGKDYSLLEAGKGEGENRNVKFK
jgi:hypothetical protein